MKKKITVVTPTFNENKNVEEVYNRVKNVLKNHDTQILYDHLFIDNASQDGTQEKLRNLASNDKNVKVIINRENYGHIKSPFYAIKQTNSDAVIFLVADLQDPPELIDKFIQEWLRGEKLVIGVKEKSEENSLIFFIRSMYYKLLNYISKENLQENFLGFGLFDKDVVNFIKTIEDPEPYLRGLVIESGHKPKQVAYSQNKRMRNFTKNNFFTLYDLAINGFTSYSKLPLRMMIFIGFFLGLLSFLSSFVYLIYKLLFWDEFQLGIAPLLILFFLFFSIIIFFLGIIAEYILAIHIKLRNRPLVIEKERINF